jgi:hypothetical protein
MAFRWNSFLQCADPWIVEYSLPPGRNYPVKLFCIGHALELYLKGTNAKMTGDIDKAVRFGHSIKRIWDDCKSKDSAFLPDHELRDSIWAENLFTGHVWECLSDDDWEHFSKHRELYSVAKMLPDLKYIHAPLKTVVDFHYLAGFWPNPYWIELFKNLRNYLGYPGQGDFDTVMYHIKQGFLPSASSSYLKGLYD